ncbi:type II toxin-antitoxin system PemK/MazF family toxin [Cohnella ginsengisoli]|uniref:Type II toxin-antitoxin system PemK/MazF family toxin n=1 Tax=Cohnella ginsengisoli TaxID=425004 RepID=A0A9X4KL55_9BACL|nr:type II toxin-antitoxin system PemK/MazF family toxin [Cohnella ginsengisoli]MDG0794078.1 type II toxin-antitoxin system PemK/MazF family toxin [Cohnella ginsengisoli]
MTITGTVERGSIVYLNLNPTKGHEQGNAQPAIVVSPGIIQSNPGSTNAWIVPITNKDHNNVMRVPVPPGIPADGTLVGQAWTELGGFAIPNHMRSIDLNARDAVVIGQVPLDSDFFLRTITIARAILA